MASPSTPAQRTRTVLVAAALAMMVLPTFAVDAASGIAPSEKAGSGTHGASTHFSPPPAPLSLPVASLAQGHGPALGHPMGCRAAGPSSARCGPAVAAPTWAWNNESAQFPDPALGPEYSEYASLAYDAADGVYVLFGGCTSPTGNGCQVTNDTWTYSDGTWYNRTSNYVPAPPARDAAAMDYDPNYGAILLFGGCGRICPLADTWTFTVALGWTNVTAAACASMCPTAVFGAQLAWDPVDTQSVLFGGCTDVLCVGTANATWEELGPGAGYGWYNGALPGAPASRSYEAMAWDPSLGAMLMYGGEYACAWPSFCGFTDTWSWNVTSGWLNQSTFVTRTPGPRIGAGLAWDNQTQSMVLFDGMNASSGLVYADTWNFTCTFGIFCNWFDITPAAAPPARAFFGAASDNALFSPWFVGGFTASGALANDQWAFGVAPSAPALAFAPSPTELSYATWFNATITGGTPSYLVSYYFPQFGGLPYAVGLRSAWIVPRALTLQVVATTVDSAGLLARGTSNLVVQPGPTLHITGPPTVDAGVPALFTASVQSGTGLAPYTFGWTFPGGATASGTTANHTFASTGTFEIELNVSDRALHTNVSFSNVTVVADPKVTASANPGAVDPGLPVRFTAGGTLGVGPYSYRWDFGDGSLGTGAGPTHAYAHAGGYRATVTLTDAVGGTATAFVNLTVAATLSAAASATPTPVRTGALVTFGVAATGGIGSYSYAWQFGDGASGAGATPQHAYAQPGAYTARVTVTDAQGASVNATVAVTVQAAPGGATTSSSFFTSPLGLLLVGVVIVAAVGAIVVAARRNRRGDRHPEAAMGETPPGAGPGETGTPPPGAL